MKINKISDNSYSIDMLKKNRKVLFVREQRVNSYTSRELINQGNFFEIRVYDSRGYPFKDRDLRENKDKIQRNLSELKKLIRRKYKKIVLPKEYIGENSNRLKRESPKTMEYINKGIGKVLKELKKKSSRSNSSSNSNSSRSSSSSSSSNSSSGYGSFNRRKFKRHRSVSHRKKFNTRKRRYESSSSSSNNSNRKSKKKKNKKDTKKRKKRLVDSIDKAMVGARKRCKGCVHYEDILNQKMFKTESRKAILYLAKLRKAEKLCTQCKELCGYVQTKVSEGGEIKDLDIIRARFPKICKRDKYENKKVVRLKNSFREKRIRQYRKINK